MPMPHFFNPPNLGIELAYTIVILIFCFLVYFKTREIYNLTKHKGIQFFRYAFIFFGLAYASRLFLYLMIFGSDNMFGFGMVRRSMMPVSNLVVAFFSTMAILYLAYSTIWKKMNSEHFLTFSNIIALFVAVMAFVSRSTLIVPLIQLVLMAFVAVIILRNHKKDKKRFSTKALYLLICAFWLLSLFALQSRRFMPFEVKIAFQLASIAVFVAIYLKVAKWVK